MPTGRSGSVNVDSPACASARWMRRSTSRTESTYWSTRARSLAPSERTSRAMSSVTESRMLRSRRIAARRSSTVPPVAEQPLEHHAGVVLHRERRGGRRPGQRVDVDAVVAVVAVPDEEAVLERQLERRQAIVAAELVRRDLVDGGGQPDVGALRHLGARRAQPARVGARVLGVPVGAVPLRVAVLHVGEDQRLVLHRREPLQDGRQLPARRPRPAASSGWRSRPPRRPTRAGSR